MQNHNLGIADRKLSEYSSSHLHDASREKTHGFGKMSGKWMDGHEIGALPGGFLS
jgi:hypothetical protein